MSKRKRSKFEEQSDSEDVISEDFFEEESSSISEDEEFNWVSEYCSENIFYCEVDEEFIRDEFNLTGLRRQVTNYSHAKRFILGDIEAFRGLTNEQKKIIQTCSQHLYGLIHARFILTPRGLSLMAEKFRRREFGKCPRVLCESFPVLPCGLTDTPRKTYVKLYCMSCGELYNFYDRKYDGAHFGTSFSHMMFLTFPTLYPSREKQNYVPRIYGFKIHSSSKQRIEEEKKKIVDFQIQRSSSEQPHSSLPLPPSPSPPPQQQQQQQQQQHQTSVIINDQLVN